MAPQHAASSACAASSITTTSKDSLRSEYDSDPAV
jgi:hypothetical protein